MIKLLNGKALSEKIYSNIKEEVDKLNRKPHLVVISVGNDSASQVYIRNKKKACEKVGMTFEHIQIDNSKFEGMKETMMQVLAMQIQELNEDEDVDGILVQKPMLGLEKDDENLITSLIDPMKDVDAFSPANISELYEGNNDMISCTPQGILSLLKEYEIKLEGKEVVIIGRSTIVGKPLALAMINENATVTVCHSKTKDLKKVTQRADILVSAIGKAKMINSSYIGDNCKVIVDVGMNRDKNGKLCGDVDFDDIKNSKFNTYYTTYITPVPGGVGPMTVASLIQNVIELSKFKKEEDIKNE